MKTQQKLKIFLMGPQGSGKGTQAEQLENKLKIPALSMGQLIRVLLLLIKIQPIY